MNRLAPPLALAWLLFISSAAAAAAVTATAAPPAAARIAGGAALGPVATVAHARIGADQVFELWSPVWYETLARVRNGKMAAAEGDRRLTGEWQRAVYALIKDELFFQEAEREHSSFINMIVDNFMRQADGRPRTQVASEVRRRLAEDMERHFRLLNASMVKDSGGMVKLHKVLEGRGLTFVEWQNRLKKKAFTQSYLHQILQPRAPAPGPRQIQKYYQDHPEEFSRPGAVRFRHIFFSNAVRGEEAARADAVELWEQLEDGEIDFETAAAEHSDDPESRGRGGLETAEEADDPEREAWLADIRIALREEPTGQLAPILESPFGCHVALPLSIGPDRKIPFNEVRDDIQMKLTNRVWEEETDRYFNSIKRDAEIRVIQPDFPQRLSCAAQGGAAERGARVFQMAVPEVISPGAGR